MTAALLDRAAHPRAADRPPPGRRPLLVPVPDCEPPPGPWVSDLPALPAAPPILPGIPAQRRVPAQQPRCDSPRATIEHRRFAPVRLSADGTPVTRAAASPPRSDAPSGASAGTRPVTTVGPLTAAGPTRGQIRAVPIRAVPIRPVPIRAVPIRVSTTPLWSTDSDSGIRHTSSADLPPALGSATMLCRALLEVLTGRRDLNQLRIHCAPDVFAGMRTKIDAARLRPAMLLSIAVCQPADGIAEVSVIFRSAGRTRALALRMQGVDGYWRITVLDMG